MEICDQCGGEFANTKALGSHIHYVHGKGKHEEGEDVAQREPIPERVNRTDVKMPLVCGDCGTEWNEHFSLPMNISVFVKKGNAIACPKCASQKTYMLPKGDFYQKD